MRPALRVKRHARSHPRTLVRHWYDTEVVSKRKISLTLDSDLVEELEQSPDQALSAQVNAAVRAEVDRRQRQRALRGLLARLDLDDGPLGPEDEPEIQEFERSLSEA